MKFNRELWLADVVLVEDNIRFEKASIRQSGNQIQPLQAAHLSRLKGAANALYSIRAAYRNRLHRILKVDYVHDKAAEKTVKVLEPLTIEHQDKVINDWLEGHENPYLFDPSTDEFWETETLE